MTNRPTFGFLVVLPVLVLSMGSSRESLAEPISSFIGGYLSSKVADEVFDATSGKPDIHLLHQRLNELEAYGVLRSEVRDEIRKLRQRVHSKTSREEFESHVSQVTRDVKSINNRLAGLEGRVELLEVLLTDEREKTNHANDSEYFAARAITFIEQKDFHRAVANCNVALSIDDSNAHAFFRRALAYAKLDAPAELVLLDSRQAISHDRNLISAYGLIADQLIRNREFRAVIRELKYPISQRLSSGHAYDLNTRRGYAYLRQGEDAKALAGFNRAFAEGKGAECLALRAWARFNLEEQRMAWEDVRQALNRDKENGTAYLVRSMLHNKEKNFAKAAKDASKAIEILQTQECLFEAYYQRGLANLSRGKLELAESDLTAARSLNEACEAANEKLTYVRGRLAPPDAEKGELVIDGKWTITLLDKTETVATIKNRVLRMEGEAGKYSHWENIRKLKSGRFGATRVHPPPIKYVTSRFEHRVEFYIDAEGNLRQDDSNLGRWWQSELQVVFEPKDLDFEHLFSRNLKRDQPDIELAKGRLPIAGDWKLCGSSRKARIMGNELRAEGLGSYWKNITLLPNGRYRATRVLPEGKTDSTCEVEFYVDSAGKLRQDDSNLYPLKRSKSPLLFVSQSLRHRDLFAVFHPTEDR